MADYDDAQSPIGDEQGYSRAPRRASGPIARVWALFSAQPMTTKVLIIGVIVVVGVVAYMALKKKPAAATSDSSSETRPGLFGPLGQNGPGTQPTGPTGILMQPPISGDPVGTAPATYPTTMPPPYRPLGRGTPLGESQQQGSQAAAYRPPVTFQITPVAASRASQVT